MGAPWQMPDMLGCRCQSLEYYTTGSADAIRRANEQAYRCLGVFALIGSDERGRPVYKHTTDRSMYSFVSKMGSPRCATSPNSSFAHVTGVKGCPCPASASCGNKKGRQHVWRQRGGWDPGFDVFVRCAIGPATMSLCSLDGSCSQLRELLITTGRTDHTASAGRPPSNWQDGPLDVGRTFPGLGLRFREFRKVVESPWIDALSLDAANFYTFRATNPAFYRDGLVLRYTNAHMCVGNKVDAPYRTSLWLTTDANFSNSKLPLDLNVRSSRSIKCYKGIEDARPASHDFTSLLGTTSLALPLGSHPDDGYTECIIRQVLFEEGRLTLLNSPMGSQFEKNWVFWGWLPAEPLSRTGRRRVFVYYLLPTTVFVACDSAGSCTRVFELPWNVPDALRGLHIASSSNWLHQSRGRYVSVLHERRMRTAYKTTDYTSRYAVLDLVAGTMTVSASPPCSHSPSALTLHMTASSAVTTDALPCAEVRQVRTLLHNYLVHETRSHGGIEYVTSVRAGPTPGKVEIAYGSGDCLARVATLSADVWSKVPVDATLTVTPEMRQELRKFHRKTRARVFAFE